jgi:adenosine deaminase
MSALNIDTHAHLSGSVSSDALWEIVVESGVKLSVRTYKEFARTMQMGKRESLEVYLSLLHEIDRLQSSPMGVELSSFNAFKHAALSGVDVLEVRFNPVKRSLKGQIDLDAIIQSALSGMRRACWTYGISGSLAFCMGTDCTQNENEAILAKAIKYKSSDGVRAIDLAGPYGVQPYENFRALFHQASDKGLETTCHAGEVLTDATESELDYVIHELNVRRIGHGIWILKSPDLVEAAKSREIMFEVCPSSNLASGAVRSVADMKRIVTGFQQSGLSFTICTDAFASLETSLIREREFLLHPLEYLEREFGPNDGTI